MGTEENKAALKRYYSEVLNKGNYALWDELMTGDYVLTSPHGTGEGLKGKEGGQQNYNTRKAQSSDSEFTVEQMVAEGDTVVIRGVLKGTNDGEISGNPATGKQFARTYVGIYQFKDGKINRGWTVQDALGFFQQLGITPPAQPVAAPAAR